MINLRRMINLSTVAKKLHHYIRLSKSFRADLSWWSVPVPGILERGLCS